jgi:hypothetical protein
MIPESSTITEEGRRLRETILWGATTLVALVALAAIFLALDKSTVVDGPTGSSFVTTATGLAALHDVLDRDGRDPGRLQSPLVALDDFDAYLVSDVDFASFEPTELAVLGDFVDDGGTAVLLGLPARAMLRAFDIEIDWVGRAVGTVPVHGPDEYTIEGARFGGFTPGHTGRVLAGSAARDLAVAFDRGTGTVVLIADSSVAHNATIARADNIDFLGGILEGRTLFDEYRHGFTDTPATGLITAAPGNWGGALILGGIVLGMTLISYGRRFGPVEPRDRDLAPDRSVFVDSVARSLRRAKTPIPLMPLQEAVRRELGLAPDADPGKLMAAARREGVDDTLVDALGSDGAELAVALDHTLAALTNRR